jgi:hypothetical protein
VSPRTTRERYETETATCYDCSWWAADDADDHGGTSVKGALHPEAIGHATAHGHAVKVQWAARSTTYLDCREGAAQ